MTAIRAEGGSESGRFRLALLGLSLLSIGGTAVELAMERHWKTFIQLIPWIGLGVLMAAALLVVLWPSARRVWLARALAVAVVGISAFGTWEHVDANYQSGPLDFRYSESWATMTAASRWWKAATKTVGPSPVLAPVVLAQAGLCVLLATIRHPALRREDSAL